MMNSIKDLEEVEGNKVITDRDRPLLPNGEVDWEAFDKLREEVPICFDHSNDMISFKVMTKPASEGGKGCQLTALIRVALHMLKYFNKKFPCYENVKTIECINEALMWQKKRTEDRLDRNVEGQDKK